MDRYDWSRGGLESRYEPGGKKLFAAKLGAMRATCDQLRLHLTDMTERYKYFVYK